MIDFQKLSVEPKPIDAGQKLQYEMRVNQVAGNTNRIPLLAVQIFFT
jgi:hypothetical protein